MLWTIQISDDNDAFADAPAYELGIILQRLSMRVIDDGELPPSILDSNGNTCGAITTSNPRTNPWEVTVEIPTLRDRVLSPDEAYEGAGHKPPGQG